MKGVVAVLGGNGYVGSSILRALRSKYPSVGVIAVSRSGKPAFGQAGVSGVDYVAGDASSSSWGPMLKERGVTGCISCVGAFGSNAHMLAVNGAANANAARVAKQNGVERFVYISTVENNLPDFVLKGYFEGKRQAEAVVLKQFSQPGHGVVLRPSFVYGTRQVGTSLSIPLGLLGRPLEALLSRSPFSQLQHVVPGMQAVLAAPVSVEHVAAVAAAAAVGDLGAAGTAAAAGQQTLGPDDIRKYGKLLLGSS